LLLAGPIVAAMMSRTAMGLIDFIMVSELGVEAQAAIVPAGVVLFALLAFGLGVTSAVNTLVSQSHGRGDRVRSVVYGWQGVWVSAALGAAALLLWPAVGPVIRSTGHAPAVAAMEIDYIRIGLLGTFPMLAAAAITNFFTGIHRPMVALWATLAANGFNIAANYALIFGHWGLPELGVAGAAWATTASACINALFLLVWWLRLSIGRVYPVRSHWRLRLGPLRMLLRIGLPAGCHFAADIAAFTIFILWLIGRFGTQELAANNIVFKFFEVAIVPCMGMGVAVTAAVGESIGKGDLDRARRFTRLGLWISYGYLATVAAILLPAGPTIIGWLTEQPAVAARAQQLLWITLAVMALDATQEIFASALRAAGDTLWPAVVGPTLTVSVMLGGGWWLASVWPAGGVLGPWLAMTVYITLLAGVMGLRYRFGGWERIDLA
jgi:MATE family multidrug resistance protein